MRSPLWLDLDLRGSVATATLANCRNCGKPKATTDPCSLDHLAAIMEFRAALADEDGAA